MATSIGRRKPKDVVFGDDLTIEWRDGEVSHYPYFGLRDVCPCAGCIDELSGTKVLDSKTIPADVRIRKAEYVGRYALRFDWSDGHNTGIYTFVFLRELADLHAGGKQPQAKPTETETTGN